MDEIATHTKKRFFSVVVAFQSEFFQVSVRFHSTICLFVVNLSHRHVLKCIYMRVCVCCGACLCIPLWDFMSNSVFSGLFVFVYALFFLIILSNHKWH